MDEKRCAFRIAAVIPCPPGLESFIFIVSSSVKL